MPPEKLEGKLEDHPLTHPVVWAAIALLVVNDHILKNAYRGWVTGKLSDIAGLVFFPLLLAAVCEWIAGSLAHRRAIIIGAALATGLVFSLIQVWSPAAELYRVGLGAMQWPFRAGLGLLAGRGIPGLAPVSHTADAGDLLALPALLIPCWLAWRRRPQSDQRRPMRPCTVK